MIFSRILTMSALFAGLTTAVPALAQVSSNRVAEETDWSVFVENDPKACWAVSAPKETVNSRDGKPVSVRRGDILLFVTYWPDNARGEVSFSGGYPFAGGSTVGIDIGGKGYELFTDGEWAWSGSSEEDARIIESLRGGAAAVVTARSSRGTKTQDTFSLQGVSAALDEARKRCAG